MRVNGEGTLDVLHELEADLCRLISRFVYFLPLGALGTHARTHLGDTSQTNYDISRSSADRDLSPLSLPPVLDAPLRNLRPPLSAGTQNQKPEIRNGWAADVRFHDCNG